jgi:3-hydroxyacyl-CoA dehydrogenase/enoyl-CoA hydratase/3-hydroxybutyryl-CoA epimerase
MQDTVEIKTHQDYLFILLGSNEDKAIVLNSNRMKSLEKTVDSLVNRDLTVIKGIIFTSPKEMSFCVGADINAIKSVKNINEGKQLAEQGQRIFSKIESLAKPTFAIIHGHCVGGGCELALACNHRLISKDEQSKLGLPETKLGILPGFGGTQRLPKLIGLPEPLVLKVPAKLTFGLPVIFRPL